MEFSAHLKPKDPCTLVHSMCETVRKVVVKVRAVAHAAATAVLAAALFPTAAFFHCAALTRQQMAGEWGGGVRWLVAVPD